MPKQSLEPRSDFGTNVTLSRDFQGETKEPSGTAWYSKQKDAMGGNSRWRSSKPWLKPVQTLLAKAISTMLLFGSLPEFCNSFETKKKHAVWNELHIQQRCVRPWCAWEQKQTSLDSGHVKDHDLAWTMEKIPFISIHALHMHWFCFDDCCTVELCLDANLVRHICPILWFGGKLVPNISKPCPCAQVSMSVLANASCSHVHLLSCTNCTSLNGSTIDATWCNHAVELRWHSALTFRCQSTPSFDPAMWSLQFYSGAPILIVKGPQRISFSWLFMQAVGATLQQKKMKGTLKLITQCPEVRALWSILLCEAAGVCLLYHCLKLSGCSDSRSRLSKTNCLSMNPSSAVT
jgi:hypothetical protein